MTSDPNKTRTVAPILSDQHTQSFDPALDAGLAAAFGPDPTPGGWSQPPLLRDDPSDNTPLVQPASVEMPSGGSDRYQLLGEIARGGMGVILKGRDPDLGRDLAFKVLKSELVGRPVAEQRFVEEAQVGGQLQHPGVVPVYDLGRFADGRPYFAMKLVKGDTLADLLTERKSPADNRGHFLQTFFQVCQTVAYAHSRGVVHRDLKPSNVMVGPFGEVLVMDWGLAKVLPRGGVADEERATQANRERERQEEPTVIHTARSGSGSETEAGSVMGTPAFMSPEQAGGEIDKLDERTDVFGLGAVLCVILTGKPPYVADSGEAVRLMAVRGELADAFARIDACGADAELVALCERCLAAERDARPRHAGEVASSVAEHLAQVEQRAHRTEVARAAAEAEAREQRKRLRLQMALAGAVGLLLIGSGAAGWWADRQAGERRTRQAELAAEQTKAEAAKDRARVGVETAIAMALSLRGKYRFTEARAALDQAAGLIPADGPVDLHDKLRRAADDLAFVREVDDIRMKRSIWVQEEGGAGRYDTASAPPAYRAAFLGRGMDVACGDSAAVGAQVRNSALKVELVAALDDWAMYEGDAAVRDRVLSVARVADPGPWLDRFRDRLVRADPAKVKALAGDVDPEALPAGTVTSLADLMWSHGIDPTRVLLAAQFAHPSEPLIPFVLGGWYHSKKSGEAIGHYRASRVTRPDNLAVLINLGSTLRTQGDLDRAMAAFREAVRLDPTFAKAHYNVGNILRKQRDFDGAVSAYKEAIRLDPKDVGIRTSLGNTLSEKGDFDEAVAVFKETIRLNPKLAIAHYNLGTTLLRKGDADGAAASFTEAIALNPNYDEAHNNLGLVRKAKGDLDGAVASYKEAIRINPKLATAHNNLGNILKAKGDREGAIACYKEAIRLDPANSLGHNNLGLALAEKNDWSGAIVCYRESIRLDPNYALAHNSLGIALNRQRDWDGAVASFREAIRLDPKNSMHHNNLGIVLALKRDFDGSVAAFKEAIRLDPKNAKTRAVLDRVLKEKAEQSARRDVAPPPRELKR